MSKKKRGCWDDVKDIHNSAIELINSTTACSQIFRDPEGLKKVVNKNALMVAGERLLRDLNSFKGRLDAISTQHINRTGGTKDPDENLIAIDIFQDYSAWMDEFNLVVTPTVNAINELINERSPEDIKKEQEAEIKRQQQAAIKEHKVNRSAVDLVNSDFKPAPAVQPVPKPRTGSSFNLSQLLAAATGEKK